MNRPVGPYLWMLWSAASFSTMGALSKVLAQSSDWRFLAFVRAALMLLFAVAIGKHNIPKSCELKVLHPFHHMKRSDRSEDCVGAPLSESPTL